MSNNNIEKFFPYEEAYTLPSITTGGMLQSAIESDDARELIIGLQHTWAHYQALELFLNAASFEPETMVEAVQFLYEQPLTEDEKTAIVATTRIFAKSILKAAYTTAHDILGLVAAGDTVHEAFQTAMPQLNQVAPKLTEEEKQAKFDKELSDFLAFLNESPESNDPQD